MERWNFMCLLCEYVCKCRCKHMLARTCASVCVCVLVSERNLHICSSLWEGILWVNWKGGRIQNIFNEIVIQHFSSSHPTVIAFALLLMRMFFPVTVQYVYVEQWSVSTPLKSEQAILLQVLVVHSFCSASRNMVYIWMLVLVSAEEGAQDYAT